MSDIPRITISDTIECTPNQSNENSQPIENMTYEFIQLVNLYMQAHNSDPKSNQQNILKQIETEIFTNNIGEKQFFCFKYLISYSQYNHDDNDYVLLIKSIIDKNQNESNYYKYLAYLISESHFYEQKDNIKKNETYFKIIEDTMIQYKTKMPSMYVYVQDCNNYRFSWLGLAIDNNATEVVNFLLDKLQINANSLLYLNSNEKCIHHAIIKGNKAIINKLIEYGALSFTLKKEEIKQITKAKISNDLFENIIKITENTDTEINNKIINDLNLTKGTKIENNTIALKIINGTKIEDNTIALKITKGTKIEDNAIALKITKGTKIEDNAIALNKAIYKEEIFNLIFDIIKQNIQKILNEYLLFLDLYDFLIQGRCKKLNEHSKPDPKNNYEHSHPDLKNNYETILNKLCFLNNYCNLIVLNLLKAIQRKENFEFSSVIKKSQQYITEIRSTLGIYNLYKKLFEESFMLGRMFYMFPQKILTQYPKENNKYLIKKDPSIKDPYKNLLYKSEKNDTDITSNEDQNNFRDHLINAFIARNENIDDINNINAKELHKLQIEKLNNFIKSYSKKNSFTSTPEIHEYIDNKKIQENEHYKNHDVYFLYINSKTKTNADVASITTQLSDKIQQKSFLCDALIKTVRQKQEKEKQQKIAIFISLPQYDKKLHKTNSNLNMQNFKK